MTQSTATGHEDHPNVSQAFPSENAPEGHVEATFTQRTWGLRRTLLCCFVLDDGYPFRLSTFPRKDYAPYQSGPSFKYARKGERYCLEIGRSQTGFPTFLTAERVDG